MSEFKASVRDPLYGLVQLTEVELAVLKTLPVSRMRWIKQMGLACLVFAGANHTRYEHSVGTMYVADRLVEALARKTGNDFLQKNKQGIRLAALLHDLGHSPFSHVTEEFFKRNPDCLPTIEKTYEHEIYTQRIIRKSEEIRKICNRSGIDYKFVSYLAIGKSKTFLDALLSSSVDVDKIDYVARDSYFCGLPYGSIDLSALEEGITLAENSSGNKVLAFEGKSKSAVEELLMSRFYLISSIHIDKKNCAAIQLLLRAIRAAYDAVFLVFGEKAQKDNIKKLILECLHFQWVDHDLITFLQDPFQKLRSAAIEATMGGSFSLHKDSLEEIITVASTRTRKQGKKYFSHILLNRVLQGNTPDFGQSYPFVSLSPSARYGLYVLKTVSPHTSLLNDFKSFLQRRKAFKGGMIFLDIIMPKDLEMNTKIVTEDGDVSYLFDLSPLMRTLVTETITRLTLSISSHQKLDAASSELIEKYIDIFSSVARTRSIEEERFIGSDLILMLFYYLHKEGLSFDFAPFLRERLFFEGDTRFQALFSVIFDGLCHKSLYPYKELIGLPERFKDLCDPHASEEDYEDFRVKGYPDFFSVKFSQDLDLLTEVGMIYTRSSPVKTRIDGQYPKRYERRISRRGREYVEKSLLGYYPLSKSVRKITRRLSRANSCLVKLGT
jgi:HD superfamily phosphohydrolase